ncbi:acyltransferase [Streptomyces sp. NPDC056682]|uniref:acyltransferase family protein n=1 Tax=Streptomyces sp. NPDC056682 TaxID=3345909 RepID=UPI00368DD991
MTSYVQVPGAAAGPAAPPPRPPARDRYFDFLRALALFRVVLYHLMGWAWLPLAFPSMGVMFALAGNLMARSLKRPAVQVVRGRLRRLLPPMWLLGAVGITGMLAQGWGPDSDGHPAWWWGHLLFWVLPLSDPPYAAGLPGIHGVLGDNWGANLAEPLWYLRAYLWFVLLSPLFRTLLRRTAWPTILAPVALSALLEFVNLGLPQRIDSALTDFATFGACWILGMARQEGVLRRLPNYLVPSLAPIVMATGYWWAVHGGFSITGDTELDSIPLAQTLWSLGAVLLLLHISPSWAQWPAPLRRWDRLITLLNSRAVTVYLWHNLCILVAATLWDDLWSINALAGAAKFLNSSWPVLAVTWILIGLCVLGVGWVEDVAAKRRPRLWPA